MYAADWWWAHAVAAAALAEHEAAKDQDSLDKQEIAKILWKQADILLMWAVRAATLPGSVMGKAA